MRRIVHCDLEPNRAPWPELDAGLRLTLAPSDSTSAGDPRAMQAYTSALAEVDEDRAWVLEHAAGSQAAIGRPSR